MSFSITDSYLPVVQLVLGIRDPLSLLGNHLWGIPHCPAHLDHYHHLALHANDLQQPVIASCRSSAYSSLNTGLIFNSVPCILDYRMNVCFSTLNHAYTHFPFRKAEFV